ncbi:MAG: GntR family transcriptional regulator [Balneolaceae bacterium]|nr:GntR family transcriptional regulator [Balneolaceae bacterium]MCH8550038.1 GntR family transcriptional regulator [Balneolaceae bacterium]
MNYSENRPIYLQISDYFCSQILSKKWKAGERIPSVREIAVRMEVNPNTAIRAFHDLQNEGILENRRGVGYFVTGDAYPKVRELKRREFIREKLPGFFRDMKQLGFSCSELEELYRKHHER